MNIENLTIGEARKIARLFSFASSGLSTSPWCVGKNYHIRTVTHYWTGRLVEVTPQELVIEEAAWIASTGRFTDFFANGPDEVEPVEGPVIIGRGAVVDAQEWIIALPRGQK